MGCLGSKEDKDSKEEPNEKPTFSWQVLSCLDCCFSRQNVTCEVQVLKFILLSFREKRQRLDPKDYTFGDLTGETVAKMPGDINGQQFIIQNNKVRKSTHQQFLPPQYSLSVYVSQTKRVLVFSYSPISFLQWIDRYIHEIV